uniref:Shugoshin-1 n=2 Tax=Noccaea caerulescens TaxID=107243 RepID=A0A1J3FUI4_NOCCA
MVRATDLKVYDHAVEGVPSNKAKGVKMVLEPPMNSAQRRKLGDITNLQNQNKLMNQEAYQQQQSFAEKLQKENTRLMKVLKERNEIIERSGIELQKYRINLQKVQEQNLQLAQTNTRILAENNTTKDQLKALQHELGCKNGLLMARKLLLEAQNLPCTCRHTSEDKDCGNTSGGACESFPINGKDHKTASENSNVSSLQVNEKANNKRKVSGRTNTSSSKVLDIIGGIGETIETYNKRRVSLRRQSAKFNIQELGVPENLNGIHDDQVIAANAGCSASDQSIGSKPEAVEPQGTKEITWTIRASSRNRTAEVETQRDPPFHDDIVEESSQVSSSVSVELKGESKNKPRGDEAEVMRKPSVGRPLRKAAEKIKSYKEASLKEKMRR